MAEITVGGNLVHTIGELPAVGSKAPDFILRKDDLSKVSIADFKGKKVVMNIFPSLDTGTCAASVRHFNAAASNLENTVVLCISRDTPFAQKRFCGAEGLNDVITLSDFNTGQLTKDYGLQITDGVMEGFASRVVIILDEEGNVTYTQQVPEVVDEPNYDEALAAL
jgi:thiol peroxidase